MHHTCSFSGTKIKQEMVEKFVAFLTICSSVEILEYVTFVMYSLIQYLHSILLTREWGGCDFDSPLLLLRSSADTIVYTL